MKIKEIADSIDALLKEMVAKHEEATEASKAMRMARGRIAEIDEEIKKLVSRATDYLQLL